MENIPPPQGYEYVSYSSIRPGDSYFVDDAKGHPIYIRKIVQDVISKSEYGRTKERNRKRQRSRRTPLGELDDLNCKHLHDRRMIQEVSSTSGNCMDIEAARKRFRDRSPIENTSTDLFDQVEEDVNRSTISEELLVEDDPSTEQQISPEQENKAVHRSLPRQDNPSVFSEILLNMECLRNALKIPEWSARFTIPMVGEAATGDRKYIKLGQYFSDTVESATGMKCLNTWWREAMRICLSATIPDEILKKVVMQRTPACAEAVIMPKETLITVQEILLIVAGLHTLSPNFSNDDEFKRLNFIRDFNDRVPYTLRYLRRGRTHRLVRPSSRPDLYIVKKQDQE